MIEKDLDDVKKKKKDTHHSGRTSSDWKTSKEEWTPYNEQKNDCSSSAMISPMKCIVDNLCWHKCSRSLICWIIQVAKILNERQNILD